MTLNQAALEKACEAFFKHLGIHADTGVHQAVTTYLTELSKTHAIVPRELRRSEVTKGTRKMNNPLSDPVREAAAQILAKWYTWLRFPLEPVREMVEDLNQKDGRARSMIEEAARQIDALRASGGMEG